MTSINLNKTCKTCNFSSIILKLDENENCYLCRDGLEKGNTTQELKKSSPKFHKQSEGFIIEDYRFQNPECSKCGETINNLFKPISESLYESDSKQEIVVEALKLIDPHKYNEIKKEKELKKKLQEVMICRKCYNANERRYKLITLLIIIIVISIVLSLIF